MSAYLQTVGRDGILANVITVNGKRYLAVGRTHRNKIRTSDLGRCAPALAALELYDVISNHIELYVSFVRRGVGPSAFVARGDQLHQVWGASGSKPPLAGNLHVLLAVFHCRAADQQVFLGMRRRLSEMLLWYEPKRISTGMIENDPVASLMYAQAIKLLAGAGLFYSPTQGLSTVHPDDELDMQTFQLRWCQVFFDAKVGLVASSLEANLLALRWNFLSGAHTKELWRNLAEHDLWRAVGCAPVDSRDVYQYRHVRKGHLFWLMALCGEVAFRMGDVDGAQTVMYLLETLVRRDGEVRDVYRNRTGLPSSFFGFRKSEPRVSVGCAGLLLSVQQWG